MMSNALSPLPGLIASLLSQATSSPASRLAPSSSAASDSLASPVMLGLVSIGICVLLVWIVRRLARPSKLSLTQSPGRTNVVNPIHLLAVLAVWLGATAMAKALLLRIAPSLETMRQDVLAELAAQAVWLGASLAVGALAFKGGLVAGMGLSPRHWLYDTGRAVLGYLAVLPICAALLYVSTRLFHHIYHSEPPEHLMLQALGTLPAAWKALIVISAVVMAPLAEEIFCRGLLQSMIRRYTRRPWLAILLTSLTFSLLHLQTTAIDGRDIANWQPMGALFALSVVLGYNYERSGRLYAPILIHALFNAVNVGIYLANC